MEAFYIGMPITFNTGFFSFHKRQVSMGGNNYFLIFEPLLKMSPHDRHIKAYTNRIYTMQYAYHICHGIYPTVIFISISLFWAFHMSYKDLR